jgi:hypothetical protein
MEKNIHPRRREHREILFSPKIGFKIPKPIELLRGLQGEICPS